MPKINELDKKLEMLNNGNLVMEEAIKNNFRSNFMVLRQRSAYYDVVITDENIKNNSRFIVDMFDDN